MTVGLVMIVRDEAGWVGPAIDSALELGIDYWVVVDTGSVDGTQELVQEKLAGIPGELHEIVWEGNAHARSHALKLARGKADLLLQLDADMVVRGSYPDELGDVFNVTVRDGRLDYGLPLLVSGRRAWEYVGATHSYLNSPDGDWEAAPSDLWVEDRRPSSRPGKIEEDLRLLQAEVDADPFAPRATFYLAQTLATLGRLEEALEVYERRIDLAGYRTERFIAMLRRARLLERLGRRELAVGAAVRAWSFRPSRAEPLYVAARLSRLAGDHEAALLFARRAADIPFPVDSLFVERSVYEWGIPLEHGAAELRCGDVHRGRQILRDVKTAGTATADYLAWIDELLEEA